MSTLEYTVSMVEAMSEERLKEVRNYIQYLTFQDEGNVLTEMLTENAIFSGGLKVRFPSAARLKVAETLIYRVSALFVCLKICRQL